MINLGHSENHLNLTEIFPACLRHHTNTQYVLFIWHNACMQNLNPVAQVDIAHLGILPHVFLIPMSSNILFLYIYLARVTHVVPIPSYDQFFGENSIIFLFIFGRWWQYEMSKKPG